VRLHRLSTSALQTNRVAGTVDPARLVEQVPAGSAAESAQIRVFEGRPWAICVDPGSLYRHKVLAADVIAWVAVEIHSKAGGFQKLPDMARIDGGTTVAAFTGPLQAEVGAAAATTPAAPGIADFLDLLDGFLIRRHVPVQGDTGGAIHQAIHDHL